MNVTARKLFPLISGLTFRGGVGKRHDAKLMLQPSSLRRKQPCEVCGSSGEIIISGSLLSDLSKWNTTQKLNPLGFQSYYKWDKMYPERPTASFHVFSGSSVGALQAETEADWWCWSTIYPFLSQPEFPIMFTCHKEEKPPWAPSP